MRTAFAILATTIFTASLKANEAGYSPPATVHLSTAAFPPGVADEQAYAAWTADRARLLLKKAGEPKDAERTVELRLAAVNWVLASQCEPPMSRWLHGIATPEDNRLTNDLTRWGLTELQGVRHELERLVEIPEHDRDAADRLDSSIELLEGFAEALRACVMGEDEPDAHSVYRHASAQLSIYLEDDRPNVAAAAKLWQAVLYQKAGRIDRSLRLLSLPSEPPANRALRYDFFGRLIRCRDLARQQSFSAAWSLLLTLEERSQSWFVTLRSRADAGRTTALARLAICDEWSEITDKRTGTWCEKITATLRDSYLPPDGDHSVIRLATAAPTIMDIPDSSDSDTHGSPEGQDAHPDAKEKPSKKSGTQKETDTKFEPNRPG